MDRLNRFAAQVYGYAVCLIAVITLLISLKSVIDAVFDLSDPLRANGGAYGRSGRPLSSFELYKLESRRSGGRDTRYPREPMAVDETTAPSKSQGDTVSTDAELRQLYNAEREERIGDAKFRAMRSLVGSILLALLASVLFWVHWRWLRGITGAPSTV